MMIAVAAALTCASGASAVAGVSSASGVSGGGWGGAREVPGTAALNKGGLAQITSVSCTSAGNCSAGGFYHDASGRQQVFVVSEVDGIWHPAIEVPGTAAINRGRGALITSVSCASPGNCSAVGAYSNGADVGQAFVVDQVNGTWHTAIRVSGIPSLGPIGGAVVNSLSCPSAGNCSAGGYYQTFRTRDYVHAFVVDQVHGTWQAAVAVPGMVTLNQGVNAQVSSVSCGSAGACGAGGFYTDKAGHMHAFVASEVNGTWHAAVEVPGIRLLDRGHTAWTTSVSCPASGVCGAGGHYTDSSGRWLPFVVSEVHGTWRAAAGVRGMTGLNQGPNGGGILSVSCASPGDCAAGGYYQDGGQHFHAFLVTEMNGTWSGAIEVPGAAGLNKGGNMRVVSVSCTAPGDCGIGGFYLDNFDHFQVFVDDEVNGTWASAIEVPGTGALNKGGYADQPSLSCAGPGECSAGGNYTDSSHLWQAYLVDES